MVAAVLSQEREELKQVGEYGVPMEVLDELAAKFTKRFKADNPKFDTPRFLVACKFWEQEEG
jgi:hypothetical protein